MTRALDGSIKLDRYDIERFITRLNFLQDKVEACYANETQAIINKMIAELQQ